MKTVTDTKGREWRVGTVITGAAARRAQIQPGYGQINLGPMDSDGNHMGLSLPETTIEAWIAGYTRVQVNYFE